MSTDDNIIEQLGKDICTLFGVAYFYSECVHQVLCNYFASSDFSSLDEMTAPRLKEKLLFAWSLTLGRLIGRIKNVTPALDAGVLAELDEAHERRDYLAHAFWFRRFALERSASGLEEIKSELSEMVAYFQALHRKLLGITEELLNGLGVPREMRKKGLDDLLEGRTTPPTQNQPFLKKELRLVNAWNVPISPEGGYLVFECSEGFLWQPCDVGLGWCAFEKPAPTWIVEERIQRHLPATVNPRPSISAPWNYSFQLAHEVTLWMAREPGSDENRWWTSGDPALK